MRNRLREFLIAASRQSRSEMEISMIKCLCVGLGGAAGAMLRYLIGLVPVGASNGFPVKTLLINILGAFVIGVLAVLGESIPFHRFWY